MRTETRRTWLDLGWSLLLSLLILGPLLLGHGYALVGDMVFVPDQPWKSAWLGLDGAVPRFVPGEAVVWLLGVLLPGGEQRLLLFAALLLAGWGMSRLTARLPWAARFAAIALTLWNPWTLERLAIGQWPMLLGWAALPWVVLGALRADRGGIRAVASWPLLLGLAGAALCSPASGLTALAVAVALLVGRSDRAGAAAVLGYGVAVNLPWLVPAALAPYRPSASPEQFSAFALHAETSGGAWLSALSGGGIWKASIVPAERGVLAVVVLAAVLAVLAAWSLYRVEGAERPVARRLLLLGAVLGAVSVLAGLGPVPDWLGAASEQVPALGLFRDAHRWLAPWLLAVAWGSAYGVAELLRRSGPGREGLGVLAYCAPVLPLALLPSLVWGIGGTLRPVEYPDEWHQVQALPPRVTVVLPWQGTYRGFDWNHRRAILDPAPRMLPGTILIDDRIFLTEGVVLASEERLLGRVAEALRAADPAAALRELGVERVLVHAGHGVEPSEVPRGRVVHEGPELTVVDLGPAAAFERPTPPRGVVLGGNVLAVLVFGAGAVIVLRARRPRPARAARAEGGPR